MRQKEKKGWVSFVLGSLAFITLVAAGLFLYAGWIGYQEAPKQVEVQGPGSSSIATYILSPEQEDNQLSYGYPEGFTILFYEEETPRQGIQTVRLETWEYYSLGFSLTFINGEMVANDPLDWDKGISVIPPPYTPDQFWAFMNLEEVIAAGGLATYIEVPLNKELMEEGTLYYADSLTFGLQEDQLVYIEALTLTEE